MRPTQTCLASVMAFGVIALSAVACSGDNEAMQASDAPIGIETSQMFVTVENKSGGPLVDLRIAVQTAGASFTNLVTRLEHGSKRELALSSFISRDGTVLNLRMVKPKTVVVTATDLTNKKFEAQAPWK